MIIRLDENGIPVRSCANSGCDREINLCNGAVKAGDMLRALDGEITFEEVRELCGLCVLKVQWTVNGKLELQPSYRKFLETGQPRML